MTPARKKPFWNPRTLARSRTVSAAETIPLIWVVRKRPWILIWPSLSPISTHWRRLSGLLPTSDPRWTA